MTTILKNLTSEKSILISNCPIESYTEYIVSVSSFSAQSDLFLSLYIFDNSSASEPLKLIAQVPISKLFTSIEWTSLGKETKEHPLGLIIGGHADGSISLWDVAAIFKNSENSFSTDFGCINHKKFFEKPVNCLACNEKPNLCAVGTDQINLLSIDKKYQMSIVISCPSPFSQKNIYFTSLNWNDKVKHILSSGINNGYIYMI